jgi:glycosyltransferase involved in cell wall biosynthesis
MWNLKRKVTVSVVVPNHGRDLSILKGSLPQGVEFVEVDLGLERSKQRNIGINKASGDAILLLDSDQSISPKLVQECVTLINMGYTAIYIPEIIIARGFFGKIRKFEREFYTGTAIDVPRFILKGACPQFDETMSGPEDSDWDRRIRGFRAVAHNPLYHHDDIGFIEYCKKKAYYSKSMGRFKEKWPNDKCLDLKYRCFLVFVEKGKWKKLVRHPILTLGIVFILAVRGWIYYTNK